jgi:hypothetical protein
VKKKIVYVVGLQGTGKSRYIAEHFPRAAYLLDIEHWWNHAPEEMDRYEAATWTKMALMNALSILVGHNRELIIVEITGMTKASQAAIYAMVHAHPGYEAEIVYLRPLDWNSFIESIEEDKGAQEMFHNYSRRRNGSWREPTDCPYLRDIVRLVSVDHSSWTWDAKPRRFQGEKPDTWEVKHE